MFKSIKKFFGFGDSAVPEVKVQEVPYKVEVAPVVEAPVVVVEVAPVVVTPAAKVKVVKPKAPAAIKVVTKPKAPRATKPKA